MAVRRITDRPAWARCSLISVWLALASLTAGCGLVSVARVTMNEVIQPDDLAFVTLGHTRFQELATRLGAPEEMLGTDDGGVAIYRFRDVKFTRIDFGWIVRLFAPVKPEMIISGAGLGTDQLVVTFDGDWIIRSTAFAHHAGAAGFMPKPF